MNYPLRIMHYALCIMLSFTACSSDEDLASTDNGTSQKAPNVLLVQPERTVLVYMAGRNNLTNNEKHVDFLKADLNEIKDGSKKLSDKDCMLVFVCRYQEDNNTETPWLARIWRGEVTDSVSVTDMGISKSDARACDPEVMEQVMRYAYDKQKTNFFEVNSGNFVIFFPDDWHIAKVQTKKKDQNIRVIVVKMDYVE